MKCPICGKELELRNKQIGTNENGDPIFNEYAICRDCKKQWNLDKQRAKRAAKKAAEKTSAEKSVSKKDSSVKQAAPEKKSSDRPASVPDHEEEIKRPVRKKRPRPESVEKDSNSDLPAKKPVPRRRPRPESEKSAAETNNADRTPARKPVRKRKTEDPESTSDKRYSNIPAEKVRSKHEKAARKSYNEMLETGSVSKKSIKKKPEPKIEPEIEEYDDGYYDDDPRFRPMRIVLALLSLIAFGYFIYRGFVTGLANTTEGSSLSGGMTYIIVALCMLVSALLYFIMMNRNTVFAFILPMIFYLGGGVFAFIQKEDDMQLLIAAVAGAALAVISLILAITSRGGYDEDEDEAAFEDDYADEDYDD